MAHHRVPLESDNEDVASAAAFWWDQGGVFIEQIEKSDGDGPGLRALLLFGREAVPGLIAALRQFVGHDSDCATHNEPAMPNGPCDCSLSR